MKIVQAITIPELKTMAEKMYGTIVRGVVDIQQKKLMIDSEMHVDMEQYLLEHNSQHDNLRGINLHPEKFGTREFIEFDSMINIRPRQNNMSRSVDDPRIREQIVAIVAEKVHE